MSDLIDREALRKEMYHETFGKDSDEQRWVGGGWIRYKMFERILASIPNAQSERKKSGWIWDEANDVIACADCGYFGEVEMRYCPNCGADNRADEDSKHVDEQSSS